MHLAKGRSGERLLINLQEELPEVRAVHLLQVPAKCAEGQGRYAVLQRGQRLGHRLRQHTLPLRSHLPQLQHRAFHLTQHIGEQIAHRLPINRAAP